MDEGVAKEALVRLCYLDAHACKVQLMPILGGEGPASLRQVAPKMAEVVGLDIQPKEWRSLLVDADATTAQWALRSIP